MLCSTVLINTLLELGVKRSANSKNRFNGFDSLGESVETILNVAN